MFNLQGRVALVTGGNGGIGLGIARGLARAGAEVVIAGRNPEKNARAVEDLSALSGGCTSMIVDVADPAAAQSMVAEVGARRGRLDILVNNAGVGGGGRTATLDLADWKRVLDVNLGAVLACSQAAHPLMKAAGGGKIINIGSMYSLFGDPGVAAYAASKGAVVQLTKVLAVEWARDNIQVNAILPGWITSEMTTGLQAKDDLSARILQRTPARRWGEPEDMEGPAVFFASAASDFVTGTTLPVDGGYSVKGGT
jgi:2-dehydro-3-deoxy-D-gluconate 5-dehydrogenase